MCMGCEWRFSYDVPEDRALSAWNGDSRHTPIAEQQMRERVIAEVDAGWERANPYEEHLFNEVRRLIRGDGAS
jgi:hypothetical protein